MIVEFSVENFRSFKEMQTLQMQAANIVSKDKRLDEQNVFQTDKLNLLKFKAIYGANGSGKSNVVLAMRAFRQIVRDSFKDEKILEKHIRPFYLDKETQQKPSFFEMVFLIKGIQYRYGFEADRNEVYAEWLFVKDKKEVPYFLREGQELEYYNEKNFSEAKILQNQGKNVFRKNSLVISVLAALNGTISTLIYNYGFYTASGLEDYTNNVITPIKIFKGIILDFIKSIDASIDDFEIINDSGKERILIKRKIKNTDELANFFLDTEEAEGTKKMFYIVPIINIYLTTGGTIILDEFDSRLHPLLSRKIVELFNSKENNSNGAQLIVATHDTNLLDADLLRRDQIVFTKKNKEGESTLIDLVEFKGVRNTASYEKDYLLGKYGALPYLNQMDVIFQNAKDYAKKE